MAIELGTSTIAPAAPVPLRLSLPARRAVSAADRAQFTEQLAMLLETGMSLHLALKTLAEQSHRPGLADAIAAIAAEVVAGKTLSTALAAHRALFPRAYVSLVAAAEGGGFMHQVLKQIVEMEERQAKLRATLTAAAAYPAFLLVFSFAVVLFVLVFVFPRFAEMFESIRGQLPFSTVVLLWVSDLLRNYWMPISGACAGAAFGLAHGLRAPAAMAAIDGMKLRVPGLRALYMQVYMARAMRVMSTSLANGVSVIDTLAASRETVGNVRFRRFLLDIEARVTRGETFASAFEQEPLVPVMVRQMIATGEQTGNLGMVMCRIADFYERELLRKVGQLSRLAEPLLLLMMGVVVGVIVASLILPIFKLSRGVT